MWNIYSQRCRSACTNADGARPTLDECIQDCIRRLRVSLGADIVDAAIAAVATPAAECSAADLEWLVSWCEEHGVRNHAERLLRETLGKDFSSP